MSTTIKAAVFMFLIVATILGIAYVDVNYTDGALTVTLLVFSMFAALYLLCYVVVSEIWD